MYVKYKKKGPLLHDPDLFGLEFLLNAVQLLLSRISHIRIGKHDRCHANSWYNHLPNPKSQFSAGFDLLVSHNRTSFPLKSLLIVRTKYKKRRGCALTTSLLNDLYAGSSLLEQSPHKILRSDPPGRLHKHNELNRSDGRSDHSADAAQLKVTSPGDRLVHPVKTTVHKSNSFLILGLP